MGEVISMRYLAAPRFNARGRLLCYGIWDIERKVWSGPVDGGLYGGFIEDILAISERLNNEINQ
jgi:hypothetical protein